MQQSLIDLYYNVYSIAQWIMLTNMIKKLGPLVSNYIYLDSCGSTNTVASKLIEAEECIEDGTLIITDKQTQGKGQRNTEWHSEPNANLTFSIVKFPKFLAPSQGFYLNFIASLAVYNALKKWYTPQLKVKWPNDIYYGDKKICGILIESTIMGKSILSSIIGIGINVNQKSFQYNTATSVSLVYGVDLPREDLLVKVIDNFNTLYTDLHNGGFNSIRNQYLSNLYWLHESHTFEYGDSIVVATIVDINISGQLVLKHSDGIFQSYDYKEIRFLY